VARCDDFAADGAALVDALRGRAADTIVVSEEVGLGVHPETEVGRRWRDAIGEVNQTVAAAADEVLLVVAGRTVRL
jgi:adenosyl cobinamide kinase/adenosyl cobinamide phosphate guanylyltransferase